VSHAANWYVAVSRVSCVLRRACRIPASATIVPAGFDNRSKQVNRPSRLQSGKLSTPCKNSPNITVISSRQSKQNRNIQPKREISDIAQGRANTGVVNCITFEVIIHPLHL